MRKILITGATSGIGLETTKKLAKGNYEIILGCRNDLKAKELIKTLTKSNKQLKIYSYPLNLASLKSIKMFTEQVKNNHQTIDVLFNNAGLFMDHHEHTEEQFEMTLGVNYIGNYYLTTLLIDLLLKGTQAQIINVCSKAALYGKFKEKPGFFTNHPHGFKAYSASKLLQLMMTKHFSKLYPAISCNAIHPGHVSTNIWKGDSMMMKIAGMFSKKTALSPETASKVGLYLIENENMWDKSGMFYENLGEEIKVKDALLEASLINSLITLTDKVISNNS